MTAVINDCDVVSQFRDAMGGAGLNTSDHIVADGKLHRFHVEGDHRSRRNGWYVLHMDDRPAGVFGCNKRWPGQPQRWSAKGLKKPSVEERRARMAKMKADEVRRAKARRDARDAAAAKARAIWDTAAACETHPYLSRKQVNAHGLRVGDWIKERQQDAVTGRSNGLLIPNALLIPIRNGEKEIVSLQAIFSDAKNPLRRDKDFIAGGEKQGCYFAIGSRQDVANAQVLIIAEGFATAASCYEATGFVSVAAFDSGNLKPVARAVRKRMPECTIVIAADNDQWTLTPINNPGLTSARAAAAATRGLVAVPKFADLTNRPTDFNDLHVQEGLREVQRQLMMLVKGHDRVCHG